MFKRKVSSINTYPVLSSTIDPHMIDLGVSTHPIERDSVKNSSVFLGSPGMFYFQVPQIARSIVGAISAIEVIAQRRAFGTLVFQRS